MSNGKGYSLAVLGSVAYDEVKTLEGEALGLGGSAVYASVAAARFLGPRLYGVVGSDFLEADRQFLINYGVDARNLAANRLVLGDYFRRRSIVTGKQIGRASCRERV